MSLTPFRERQIRYYIQQVEKGAYLSVSGELRQSLAHADSYSLEEALAICDMCKDYRTVLSPPRNEPAVLVACECSSIVQQAFTSRGIPAWSCDLLPAFNGSSAFRHIQDDVLQVLNHMPWSLVIAHPPCTYLCSSGMHWTTRGKRDPQLTEDALALVRKLLDCAPRVCVENPVGVISTRIRKPEQYIQPYNFGEDASKKTGLWLKGLPLLEPTNYIEPRIIDGKPRWANQTDSGQNRLRPSPDRCRRRSVTYPGIAAAMAEQWGRLILPYNKCTKNTTTINE